MNKRRRAFLYILLVSIIIWGGVDIASAAPIPGIDLQIRESDNPQQVVDSLQLLALLTVIALAPAIMIMMTSFTRIVIVLAFVRNALATQQIPPNQVLIGLAFFLTLFTMTPVYEDINREAITPYLAGQLSQEQALNRAENPIRDFMLKQTREKDLALFIEMSGSENPANQEAVSLKTLIPAFVISELKTAFQMGFYIYIPFLVIDIVVASTLMSMGMFMVPPIVISLPFKILLFVITDGWYLVCKSLLESFL